jgi:outer membrane protein TolC
VGSCAALWLAVALPVVNAEPLEAVVRYALENHPRTRAALAGAEAGGFLLEQARAARFPQLALVADPGRLYSGAGGGSEDVGDLGLRGSVLLYDGGRTRQTIERERDRLAVADAGLQLTSEDLAARVAEVYLEWFRQQQLAKIAADNVAAHESLYERVREIASFDRGRASDLLQVGARLEQARLARAVREGAAAEARAVLSAVVGREVATVEQPRDPLPSEPGSRAAALALLDAHPAVRAAEAEASASERSAQLAAAWSRPRIDLVASLESPTDLAGERRYFDDRALRLAATARPGGRRCRPGKPPRPCVGISNHELRVCGPSWSSGGSGSAVTARSLNRRCRFAKRIGSSSRSHAARSSTCSTPRANTSRRGSRPRMRGSRCC